MARCSHRPWQLRARGAEPQPTAELSTYATEDGQSYFALSLMPPADAAKQSQPRDIVILFDTSASQIGVYRDAALSGFEVVPCKSWIRTIASSYLPPISKRAR